MNIESGSTDNCRCRWVNGELAGVAFRRVAGVADKGADGYKFPGKKAVVRAWFVGKVAGMFHVKVFWVCCGISLVSQSGLLSLQ